jgi:hypothetical protein
MALHEYERLLAPARERFSVSPGVRAIQSSRDDAFLEAFLLHFCALGSRMTAPVERWICGAAERCAAIGLSELARALGGHARAEAGHDLMMIADARRLAARWNGRRKPSVDADILLNEAPLEVYCNIAKFTTEILLVPRPMLRSLSSMKSKCFLYGTATGSLATVWTCLGQRLCPASAS